MTQVLFGSNASPSLPNLDANFTELYSRTKIFSGSGTTTVVTTIPIGSVPATGTSSEFYGGGVCVIKGAGSSSGVAFARAYVLALRVSGGSGADVSQTTLGSAGEAGEVFTFGSSGGFVTITASGTTPGHFKAWFFAA